MKKGIKVKWILPFRLIKNIKSLLIVLTTISLFNSGCSCVHGVYRVVDASKSIYIVDINAKTSTKENPVTLELNAGTYQVSVIGTSEGGAYNAWTYWFLKKYWINKYSYSSSEFPEVTFTDNKDKTYETSTVALANAKDSKFTLKNTAKVYFYVNDAPYYDNKGGISLQIAPVTEHE